MLRGRIFLVVLVAVCATAPAALPTPALAQDEQPNLSLWPEDGGYMTVRPALSGRSDVGGSSVSEVEATIRDTSGVLIARMHATSHLDSWQTSYPAAAPSLEHGEQYDVHVRQRYSDGSRGVTHRVTADGRAPDFTITDAPPAETTDRSVYVAGTVNLEPGDRPYVYIRVGRTFAGAWWTDPYTEVPVAGGRFAAEMAPVPELGDYRLVVGMSDEAYQGREVAQPIRFYEEPAPIEPQQEAPVQALATRPPPDGPSEEVVETVADTRRSAIGVLRRAGLGTLVRRGVRIPVDASVPGRVTVQLFAAGSGARAAATRRALAQAVRALPQAGSGALTLRLGPRARRALRKARTARLTIRVRFAPLTGAPLALETPLTLRR